jgi:uncharacterized protein (DUF2236 family)
MTATWLQPTVARKINREVVLLLGWRPAILLQVAHPLVAAGVADHSTFSTSQADRWARLERTVKAMLALTFGTPADAQRAADGINAIHDRVHGQLASPAGPFPAGAAYSAHDPELLRWVHCTLLAVLPRTYELLVGPLTPAELETYYAEATRMGPALGLVDGYLPGTPPDLRRYLDLMAASGELVVTPAARYVARELFDPPAPLLARPALALTRLIGLGLLPPGLRAAYGYRWTRAHQLAFRLLARLIRTGVLLTPARLRHWPAARRLEQSSVPIQAGHGPLVDRAAASA